MDTKTRRQQARRAKIRAALQRFGFSTLRGLQGAALRRVLSGKDTLVLMPTGGASRCATSSLHCCCPAS